MNRRLKIGFPLAMVFMSESLSANGGGYSFGIEETGQILAFELEGVENIQMVEEELNIHLGAKEAVVNVRYLLRNTGKKTKIRFGFPIEDRPPSSFDFLPIDAAPTSTQIPTGIHDYAVKLDGKALSAEWKVEPKKETAVKKELTGLAGWLVSEALLPAKSDFVMAISYRVEHVGSNFSISDDTALSSKVFQYRFSSGAVWKGPITKGLVTITVGEGVTRNFVELTKPVNRFQKTASGWSWAFENFEPTLADDLEIAVTPAIEIRSVYAEGGKQPFHYLSRGSTWSRVHSDYNVKASSTLPAHAKFSYQAENVLSWRLDDQATCWAEGQPGSGVGEWLELKPEKPTRLIGLEIAGGYQDNERKELYRANARPKVMALILNEQHHCDITLSDSRSSEYYWIEDYPKPVKSLKLVVKEVYPGEQFQDLCISKISLMSYLDKPPKHQGAR